MMPDAEEIIQGLFMIANGYTWAAVAWHVFIYFLIAALILKWKPTNRTLSVLLSLPLLTVSLFAWIAGNPFNGSLFLIFGILLIILGLRNPDSAVATGHTWSTVLGIIILIFGLLYPHFLDTENYFTYLYAAPTGLIPCPTLSAILGFAILYQGFHSRAWAWVLVIPGLIYGLIGIFRLQVFLDMVLILAALILILSTFRLPKKTTSADQY